MNDARRLLIEAHDFLVSRSRNALMTIPQLGPTWGIEMKRCKVDLQFANRPRAVCKDFERLGEVVNMVATLERLIAALGWFEKQPEFRNFRVKVCHPSTSNGKGSNDLVLEDGKGNVVVRCELSDVISNDADTNGKERREIASLGWTNCPPTDGVRRFICTSPEFASGIQSLKRKWAKCTHRYREFRTADACETILVELVPAAGPITGTTASAR